jgi:hypothetical protein
VTQGLLLIAALACGLAIPVNVALYGALTPAFSQALTGLDAVPAFALRFPLYTTAGSSMAALILLLALVWLVGRRWRASTGAEARRVSLLFYGLGIIAVTVTFSALGIHIAAFLSALGVGLVGILALGALLMWQGWRCSVEARGRSDEGAAPPDGLTVIGLALVGGGVLVALAQFLGAGLSLNLLMLIIPTLPHMAALQGPAYVVAETASALASNNYGLQAAYATSAWAVLSMALIPLTLLSRSLSRLGVRRPANQPQAGDPERR